MCECCIILRLQPTGCKSCLDLFHRRFSAWKDEAQRGSRKISAPAEPLGQREHRHLPSGSIESKTHCLWCVQPLKTGRPSLSSRFWPGNTLQPLPKKKLGELKWTPRRFNEKLFPPGDSMEAPSTEDLVPRWHFGSFHVGLRKGSSVLLLSKGQSWSIGKEPIGVLLGQFGKGWQFQVGSIHIAVPSTFPKHTAQV